MKAVIDIASVVGLVLAGLAAARGRGPDPGAIVGWGQQIVVPASQLSDLVAAAGGWYHGLGLKADGSVVAWGSNESGQCNIPAPNSGFAAIARGQVEFGDINPFIALLSGLGGT